LRNGVEKNRKDATESVQMGGQWAKKENKKGRAVGE
jgi:hypothetical protein